jgi:hypothetical protein
VSCRFVVASFVLVLTAATASAFRIVTFNVLHGGVEFFGCGIASASRSGSR